MEKKIKILIVDDSRIFRSALMEIKMAPHVHVPTQSIPTLGRDSGIIEAIVIGVSTGGPKALTTLLPQICKITELPIFIVQHMPPLFTKSLAESLNGKCTHTVVEAWNDMKVDNNYIYIAPGGMHMLLRKDEGGNVTTITNKKPPENGCRPSVDVLFRSAAMIYPNRTIAIVLTGMGSDGTKGLGPLKRAGATVLIQDEETSVVWGMPGSAVESGFVDEIAPLQKLSEKVRLTIENRTKKT